MTTIVPDEAPRALSTAGGVTNLPAALVMELIQALYDDLAVSIRGLKGMSQAVSSDPRLLELIALTRSTVVGATQHLDAFEQLARALQADLLLADALPVAAEG
jgi:hypothetical protein